MDVNEIDSQLTILLAIAVGTGVAFASEQENIVLGIFLTVGLSVGFVKYLYQD